MVNQSSKINALANFKFGDYEGFHIVCEIIILLASFKFGRFSAKSPIHQIKNLAKFPAIMVVTGIFTTYWI